MRKGVILCEGAPTNLTFVPPVFCFRGLLFFFDWAMFSPFFRAI
ncbi:hypothetical protein LEP1GSC037_1089 [Leptospira interrogans str. 2006001854]|uniref:Uncharacterized protein n=10 Tax=Leptospira interrogans TaxID=173 RepID=M6GCQ9_LEPIR|nr:hypothetical protein LEP1GSC037_1089 [Leptospira interrogans str. 2006001854]